MTGPGDPFEIREEAVRGRQMRIFARATGTLSSLFERMPALADREFIISGERRLSYAEVHRHAAAIAALLTSEHGVRAGDRVALAMHNQPEWMSAFIAISSVGAIPALINSRGAGSEMRYCIDEVGAVLTIVDERRAETLRQAGHGGAMLVLDEATVIEAMDSNADALLPTNRSDTDSPACIMFTSGTTGHPKGAVISHRAMLTGLMMAQHAGAVLAAKMAAKYNVPVSEVVANQPQPAALLIFPLFHVSGCQSIFLAMLARAGKIVLLPRWKPADALQLFERERITEFTGPPSVLWDLIQCVQRTERDLSALRAVASGGQALPLTLLEAMDDAFPGRVFGGGYGMTETSGSISLAMDEAFTSRPQFSGQVHPVADVIVTDEQGKTLAPGEVGEIRVRGPMVMSEYWGRPEATAKVIDADGRLRTGDLGYLDEDHYLAVVDRMTNMVISKGENIYCAEVERVLLDFPGVADAVAFGEPDDRLGERLCAIVVPQAGATLTANEIIDHARDKLADYKIPARIEINEQPIPRNATGKIDRRVLSSLPRTGERPA